MIKYVKKWRRRVGLKRLKELSHATNNLYRSSSPFAPYQLINNLQRAFPKKLSCMVNWIIPISLRYDSALRVQEIVCGYASANWVEEAVLSNANKNHRAGILAPPKLYSSWNGLVNKPRSFLIFILFVFKHFQSGVQRYKFLCWHASNGPKALLEPYIIALNTPVGTSHYADKEGVVHWLKHKAPFGNKVEKIWVSSKFQSNEDYDDHPKWIVNNSTPFSRLDNQWKRISFYLHGGGLIFVSFCLLLVGRWQAIALLVDLIELSYFRRLPHVKNLLGIASFLGDMSKRYLWLCDAEKNGVVTPLIYYASSYTLYHYDPKAIDDGVVTQEIMANHWHRNWYQTQSVADCFTGLLADVSCGKGIRHHENVGSFDMVGNGHIFPTVGERAVAIFDVEPCVQLTRLTRHGYIFMGNQQNHILLFWEQLAELAEELDFVLVHKVKRVTLNFRSAPYVKLLKMLASKGRYIALEPDISVMKVLNSTKASVVLPFTSICDVAKDMGRPTIYLDCFGQIKNSEYHAMGTPVAKSKNELKQWLIEQYGLPLGGSLG